MTRLYGFTTVLGDQHVIGLGCRCFVWNIYIAKVPRWRLKGFCFMIDASHIVFHMKYNSRGKFRFFGYTSIDEEDLMNEENKKTMATIRSYTDIEQSKKLAEMLQNRILPYTYCR